MLPSCTQGIPGIPWRIAGIGNKADSKITYKKGSQRSKYIFNSVLFNRVKYDSVISYEVPQILHGYCGIYTPSVCLLGTSFHTAS